MIMEEAARETREAKHDIVLHHMAISIRVSKYALIWDRRQLTLFFAL